MCVLEIYDFGSNYACMQGCIPVCMRLYIPNHACATMYMYMLCICNYAVDESQGTASKCVWSECVLTYRCMVHTLWSKGFLSCMLTERYLLGKRKYTGRVHCVGNQQW